MTSSIAVRSALLISALWVSACSSESRRAPHQAIEEVKAVDAAPVASTPPPAQDSRQSFPACNATEVKRLVAGIIKENNLSYVATVLQRNPAGVRKGPDVPSEYLDPSTADAVDPPTQYKKSNTLFRISNTRTTGEDAVQRECAATATSTSVPTTDDPAVLSSLQISYKLSITDDGELWADVKW